MECATKMEINGASSKHLYIVWYQVIFNPSQTTVGGQNDPE